VLVMTALDNVPMIRLHDDSGVLFMRVCGRGESTQALPRRFFLHSRDSSLDLFGGARSRTSLGAVVAAI